MLREVWPEETPPDVPIYVVRVHGPLPPDWPELTVEPVGRVDQHVASGDEAEGKDENDWYFVIVEAETGRLIMTGNAHQDWP